MTFQKFTQAEQIKPVTPAQNEAANDEKQRTGRVSLSTVAPKKDCGCSTPCGMPCGNY